ncbi:hypothetical protein [Borrelia sp. P9F1]|uniref:hypothetical protein n=1 Tax=Borrelia sp. P9F1 TaxID=3058374 RepID=UPI0026471152|nr:hypothetical protein [Borrelia sp. P9F1]WKC58678.1 hypothetical protein QYZ68_05600 [Borrelia sp. P9F1]
MKKINIMLSLVLTVALVGSCNLGKFDDAGTTPEDTKTLATKPLQGETAPEQAEVKTADGGLADDVEERLVDVVGEVTQADNKEVADDANNAEEVADKDENAEEGANVNVDGVVKAVGEAGKADDADQAKKAKEDAQRAAAAKAEAEKAFRTFKARISKYKRGLESLKTKFDKLASKTEVEIPPQIRSVTTADKDKIHASLGYNNAVNQDLNKAIRALQLGGGSKDEEIKIVSDLLKMLVDLDDATKKIFEDLLRDNILEQIKSDKSKIDEIDKMDKMFDSFTRPRSAFVRNVQKIIKTAATKRDAASVKAELKKIIELATQP